jgi:hypothetical protein
MIFSGSTRALLKAVRAFASSFIIRASKPSPKPAAQKHRSRVRWANLYLFRFVAS